MKKSLALLFRFSTILALLCAVLLCIVDAHSEEFIITVITLAINVVLAVVSAILLNTNKNDK